MECNQQPEKLERKLEDVDLELRVLKKGSNELRQMVIVKDAKIAQFEEHLQQLDLRLERFHQVRLTGDVMDRFDYGRKQSNAAKARKVVFFFSGGKKQQLFPPEQMA